MNVVTPLGTAKIASSAAEKILFAAPVSLVKNSSTQSRSAVAVPNANVVSKTSPILRAALWRFATAPAIPAQNASAKHAANMQ